MPIQIADAYKNSDFAQRQTGLVFNLPHPDETHEQLPEGISLCMIVKNEERFLAECLESVKDCVDEICIVDTGSTDRTVEIARSYGAKIEFREWRSDFGWARNESLAMATKRWSFVLDADEELAAESVALMRSLRTTPAAMTGVYINIVNLIDDSTGSGTMSHRLIRIAPTRPNVRFKNVIHEVLGLTDGEMHTVLSPVKILHKGYTNEILTSKSKNARNTPMITKAYEENGEDSFALFNFGNSALCAGDTDRGVEVLERMLKNATSIRTYFPIAYMTLAQTYAETYGDNEKALTLLEDALAKFPYDANLFFVRGQVLAKQAKYEEAREAFNTALSLRELMAASAMTDEELYEWKIYYATAGSYERQGESQKALEYIDLALRNKPTAIHLQRTKAHYLESMDRFYDAEVMFRTMAETSPDAGRVELVNFLLRRKRFAQAIAIVESDIDPATNGEMVAQLNIAAAQAALESRTADPLPFIEAALRRSPGNGSAIKLMEQLLTERGDVAGLDRLHRDELVAPCVRPEDFARRSFRFLALNRVDEARDAADLGLSVFPRSPELRFNSALASLRLGDEARAASEFGRVDESSPTVFAQAMQMRAALLLKSGDRESALEALERWMAAEPENVDAIITSAQLLAGSAARDAGRAVLERHVDLDRRVALELAGMLMQDGDLAGAGRVAEKALQ